MSFPLIIAETTGTSRSIILTGRALPYQGVVWGGTQRVNVNYFPGNPVATAQVIGQTYKPTRMNGMWKDWFLDRSGSKGGSFGFKSLPSLAEDNSGVTLFGFPAVSAAGQPLANDVLQRTGPTFASAGSVPEQAVGRARTVRDAFELIRRSGQILKVEWGSIVRYGFLTDADFSHDREEDIGWDIEFTWIGDTDASPTHKERPKLDPLGALKKFIQELQKLLALLTSAFLTAFFAVLQVKQLITQIGSLVTGLLELFAKFASLALVPLEILGTLRQQLTSIALSTASLVAALRSVPAAYLEAGTGADAGLINFAQSLSDAIRFNAQVLGANAVRQKRELEGLEEDALLALFISPGGITLRDVSTKFYGVPDNWTEIQDFNGFSSSSVPRGTVVRIPRLGR